MAVEDYPKFAEWQAALDLLTQAKEALSNGNATQPDVDKAQAEYDRISGEVDA